MTKRAKEKLKNFTLEKMLKETEEILRPSENSNIGNLDSN
jgi:hypothetical protein